MTSAISTTQNMTRHLVCSHTLFKFMCSVLHAYCSKCVNVVMWVKDGVDVAVDMIAQITQHDDRDV